MKSIRLFAALLVAALVGAIATATISPMLAQSLSAPITITTTPDGKIISESGEKQLTLSGSDLALRVDRMEKGKVVGTLVANVNGQWVPVQLSDFIALAR